MADKKRDIKYIDRDFSSFRNKLIEYSKTYFPNTYNDFSDTSTGMLFMEMAAYVGDVLGFYLDNQIQETFIQRARQTENLFNLAYLLGYRPKVTTTATTNIDFYQLIPSKVSSGVTVPDWDYCLLIPENTEITSNSNSNIRFLTQDVVDFSVSSSMDPTTLTINDIDSVSTQPTYYLLKKTRKAVSSKIVTTTKSFPKIAPPDKFSTVDINASNIIGILDVFDSEGNQWYEVPNLAQESVFDTIRNTNTNDPNYSSDSEVPYLLRLKQVQRRFTTRFQDKTTLQLQFGAGSAGDTDEEIIPNPDNVGLGLPFEKSKLTTAFSPVNFVFTNTYGINPSDTTLTIRYLTGGGVSSNVEANSLTVINTSDVVFTTPNLHAGTADVIFATVISNNEKAADGGSDGDTVEELRQNALGNFQNQLRTVTQQDYLIRALSMPPNLGVISKAYTTPTKISEYQLGELPTILDLYVLSQDINKKLRTSSPALKQNLRTYLSEYRMINDSIKIKDAYIINIGIEFDIIVLPNYNNNRVITNCINTLIDHFSIDRWQINQPIILKDLNVLLDKVEGVQTVKRIKILNKTGTSSGYSDFAYDVEGATVNDVVYPSVDPMIFEVKSPESDIKGRVVTL
jgi:hypothetical protein